MMHNATMHIRLATAHDIPGILAISNWAALHTHANFSSGEESLESWQHDYETTVEKHPWFVIVHDHAVIAFAKSSPFRGRCAYAWSAEVTVYVDPAHHRRGLARALYGVLLPVLEAQQYATLLAQIALPNAASERLHEAFGFRRIGVLERVGWKFDRWFDVAMYEKTLLPAGTTPKPIRPVREVLMQVESLLATHSASLVGPSPAAR